jgi:hypothetical protein
MLFGPCRVPFLAHHNKVPRTTGTMDDETILPDFESICRTDRKFPGKSLPEKYRLCQRDVCIRLSGGKLCADRRAWKFPEGRREVTREAIRDHNRATAISVVNARWRWRHLVDEAVQEFGLTREEFESIAEQLRREGQLSNY